MKNRPADRHQHDHGPVWVPPGPDRLAHRPDTFWGKAKQFLWGLLFFEYYHELRHERARYSDILNVVLYGELLGIPLMNSTMGLRLLPYTLPELSGWLHRQAEEREVLEEAPHIH